MGLRSAFDLTAAAVLKTSCCSAPIGNWAAPSGTARVAVATRGIVSTAGAVGQRAHW